MLTLKDLSASKELDRKALTEVRGGSVYNYNAQGAASFGSGGLVGISEVNQGQFVYNSDDDAYLRTRAQVKVPLSERWAIEGAVEPYLKFGADSPLDNVKNTLTLEYQVAKGAKLDLFYMYRPDYAKSYDRTFHIVGTELKIDVKWPKKAKASAPSR